MPPLSNTDLLLPLANDDDSTRSSRSSLVVDSSCSSNSVNCNNKVGVKNSNHHNDDNDIHSEDSSSIISATSSLSETAPCRCLCCENDKNAADDYDDHVNSSDNSFTTNPIIPKRVSFNEEYNTFQIIQNRQDYTNEERDQLWISQSEYQQIKSDIEMTVSTLVSLNNKNFCTINNDGTSRRRQRNSFEVIVNDDDYDTSMFCTRGLETKLNIHVMEKRSQYRTQHLEAVLQEQDFQVNVEGHCDIDTLAFVSCETSQRSRTEALKLAAADNFAIRKYYLQ